MGEREIFRRRRIEGGEEKER